MNFSANSQYHASGKIQPRFLFKEATNKRPGLSLPIGRQFLRVNWLNGWQLINTGLLVIALIVVLNYIFATNNLTALRFHESTLENQFKTASTAHGEMVSQRQVGGSASLESLLGFARQHGLVELATVEYLSAQQSVAQNR